MVPRTNTIELLIQRTLFGILHTSFGTATWARGQLQIYTIASSCTICHIPKYLKCNGVWCHTHKTENRAIYIQKIARWMSGWRAWLCRLVVRYVQAVKQPLWALARKTCVWGATVVMQAFATCGCAPGYPALLELSHWAFRTRKCGHVKQRMGIWCFRQRTWFLGEIMIIPHSFSSCVRRVFTGKDVLHMLVCVRILDWSTMSKMRLDNKSSTWGYFSKHTLYRHVWNDTKEEVVHVFFTKTMKPYLDRLWCSQSFGIYTETFRGMSNQRLRVLTFSLWCSWHWCTLHHILCQAALSWVPRSLQKQTNWRSRHAGGYTMVWPCVQRPWAHKAIKWDIHMCDYNDESIVGALHTRSTRWVIDMCRLHGWGTTLSSLKWSSSNAMYLTW